MGVIAAPDLLLDVSRLIWRASSGRLPTGIDRVCLAYVERYRARSRAVVQYRSMRHVLSRAHSDRLFTLLLEGSHRFRRDAARLILGALSSPKGMGRVRGTPYLNLGHTGLDQPNMAEWFARSGVHPIFLVHDIIPISHPEYCRAGEHAKHIRRLHTMLKSGFGLICNSGATRDAVASYAAANNLPLPPTKIAWLGTTPLPAPTELITASSVPYFVMLGTIEGRKNHLLMLQIWAELIHNLGAKAPRLIIIGQRGWECQQVTAMLDRSQILKEHVVELPHCNDQSLANYLHNARALLFPTFVEGFGIPLIESLNLGTPVITSDIPVFRELAGSIPDYLSPTDGHGWKTAILDYTDDTNRRRLDQTARLVRYRAPTWEDHFRKIDPWITQLLHYRENSIYKPDS